jgi:hypothetical protein
VQFEIRMVAYLIIQNACELRLFALNPIRMLGDIRNTGKVELRYQTVLLRAILERWCFESLSDQWLGSVQRMQHIKCRRMERRCSRFLR